MPSVLGRITANHGVIYPRYDPAAFIGREWLVGEVARFRDSSDGRQLIIVGEPGSGKSAFIAYLAEVWNCPCHFIRVDNIGGVTGISPRNFLISIGEQLYQKYGPDIFARNESQTTKLTVGMAKDKAEVVGRFIDELYTLPFLPQPKKDVWVRVGIATDQSRIIGEHVKKLLDVTPALDESTLLHVAVIHPLQEIKRLYPQETVVILVDALDESLQHPGPRIVDIIPRASDADYPPNLRLVMTSRGDDELVSFRAQDLLYLNDRKKGYWQESLKDTKDYIFKQLKIPRLAKIVGNWPVAEIKAYITTVQENGDGNFLFLYYFFNELSDAVSKGETDLKKIRIPKGLDEIYRNFAVAKIRDTTSDFIQFTAPGKISEALISQWRILPGVKQVLVTDQKVTLNVENVNLVLGPLIAMCAENSLLIKPQIIPGRGIDDWEKKYLPLLGVLAVAQEALRREQLAGFAGVEVAYVDRIIAQLKQFLDPIPIPNERENRYRIYHISFSEYLLDSSRNRDYPLDGPTYHYQVASYYRGAHKAWSEVNWDAVKDMYPFQYLARHLLSAARNDELYALIGKQWMDIQFARTDSHRAFAEDVALAVEVAGSEKPPNLLQLVRDCLIYATLLAPKVPPQALGILAWAGQADKARTVASLIQDRWRQSMAYCSIGQALLANGQNKAANEVLLQALEAAKDATYKGELLEDIAPMLVQVGSFDGWLATVHSLEEGDKAQLLYRVPLSLAQFADRGKAVEAMSALLALTESFKDTSSKARARGKISQALAQLGEITRATELANEVVALAETTKDEPSKVWALTTAAEAFTQLGDRIRAAEVADSAWIVAKAIKHANKLEGAEMLGAAVQALAHAGEFDRALGAAETIEDKEDKYVRAHVLSGIVQTMIQAQEFDRAVTVANSTSIQLLTVGGLIQIAQALVQAGETSRAIDIANHALAAADAIEEGKDKELALNMVAEALCKAGQIDRALAVAEAIKDPEHNSALISIAEALAEAGDLERAFSVVAMMPYDFYRSIPLHGIAVTLAKAGKVKEALAAAEKILDKERKAHSLSAVAWALAQAGKHESAAEVADRVLMLTETIKEAESFKLAMIGALSSMAQALAQSGAKGKAVEVANRALATVEVVEDMDYNKAQAVHWVVPALARADEFDRAIALAKEFKNKESKLAALTASVWASSQLVDREKLAKVATEALATLRGIEDRDKAWALGTITLLLALCGEKKKAAAVANQALAAVKAIKSQLEQAEVLRGMVDALVQVGKLDRLLRLVETIENKSPKALMLVTVALSMIKAGKQEKALEIANQALSIADTVEETIEDFIQGDDFFLFLTKVYLLASIAVVLARAGDTSKAVEVANRALAAMHRYERDIGMIGEQEHSIGMIGEQEHSLVLIAEALAEAGKFDEALAALEMIRSERGKGDALSTVTPILLQSDHRERALSAWVAQFSKARLASRDVFLDTLGKAASFISALDQGQTLWNIYKAVVEVEGWWERPGAKVETNLVG